MDAKLYSADGSEKGTATLPDELFAQPVNEHLLWLSVKRHLGNQRQGTAKVKNRAAVSGGGRKPWRQKGTGRARAGTTSSPIWKGGGRAFGPRPRDYRTDLPRQQRLAALTSALSLRAGEAAISVLEAPSLDAPKTSAMAGVFSKIGLSGKRTLLVMADVDPNVMKSCRNLPNVRTMLAHQLNPYELIACDTVLLTEDGLTRVKETFG
jgi:large subunit ribosomal protein L4